MEELLVYFIGLLATGAVALLGLLYKRLAERYDWIDELAADEVVDEYIMKGVMHVKAHLIELTEKYGKEIELNSKEGIQEVVKYVMSYAPKAIQKLGFTEEYVTDLVEGYLFDEHKDN